MTPDSTVPSDTDRLAEIGRRIKAATDTDGRSIGAIQNGKKELRRAAVADLEFLLERNERLAKWREIHQPEKRYTPDDGETSYATYSEAADASFDGVGTPRSVTFFEICSHCASIEMAEGCEHDYRESLWPCKDAEAAGLGEGDGQ